MLDLVRGTWGRPGDEDDIASEVEPDLLRGARLLVRDTRDLLLVQPHAAPDERLLRGGLADYGYRVIELTRCVSIAEQLTHWPELFD